MGGEHLHDFAQQPADSVLARVSSSRDGLTDAEAARRILLSGRNVIAEKQQLGLVREILTYFKSPLIIILVIIAIISFAMGETVNAIIVAVMVLLSVGLDFFQEHKADRAAERLRERVVTKTTVIRSGARKEIAFADLVCGDLVFLSAGNLIPADLRILEAKDFFVNQSSLTGESLPAEKSAKPVVKAGALADLTNILFLGSSVISGSATAVVIKTGGATEYGKIAATLAQASAENDFERGIRSFGMLISRLIIFLVLAIFLASMLLHRDLFQSFLFAVAIAVGLTPELLPMIMSVTMSMGSVRMARKGVIVKRLTSITTFGSIDILCTDKTGTLTEDRISLVKYTDVAGREDDDVLLYTHLNSSLQTGIKNPLDEAVLRFKNGAALESCAAYQKIDEIPFDFVRKKVSVVVERRRKRHLITKGAPEEVFKSCTTYARKGAPVRLTAAALAKITEQYYAMSRDGYRVLAVAVRPVGSAKHVYEKEDECGLMLAGFVAFLDPPKQDAGRVVKELQHAGIEVKVITGDNELVTRRICEEVGINVKGVLLGHEIDDLSDEALRVRARNTTIFARFSPDEKTRVILALRATGAVVGYMGDGINDAPSLKTADVGISVDTAVDVAKESADIILTRKSLSDLREGVLEGRRAFANTMKYIMMGVSSNFGNMFSVIGAVLFLPFLPMLPLQILLNNLIYDFSQITIPSDNVDPVFVRKPRHWDFAFIKRFLSVFGPISSLFDFLTFFVLFSVFKTPAAFFQTGWFLESLATQTLVIYVIRTKHSPFSSMPSRALFLNTIICVAIGWAIPFTPLGRLFGFVPIPARILAALAAIVIVYLVVVEIVKRWFYKSYDALAARKSVAAAA